MGKILLVEDDYLLSEMYSTKLRLCGYQVAPAHNSEQAFDILDAADIDLILLDMALPRSNGVVVLHELKSYSDWRHIPIIILSNMTNRDVKLSPELLKSFGVKRYLVKSKVKPQDVVDTVGEVMTEGEQLQD